MSERWKGRQPPRPKGVVALAPTSTPPEPLTAADRARIAKWVAAQIVSYRPDRCLRCRRPIVYGAKWVELVNDNDRSSFPFRLRACVADAAGDRRAQGNGARPERTQMKLITPWGVCSRRLDRLLAAECSHGDSPLGRLTRHRATRRAIA